MSPRSVRTAVVVPVLLVASLLNSRHGPVVGGVEVTPDNDYWGAATAHASGWTATYQVLNTRTVTTTYSLTCSSTGQVTCGTVTPSSVILAPDQSANVTVSFSTGEISTEDTLRLRAGGPASDSGSYTLPVQASVVKIVVPSAFKNRAVVRTRQPLIRAMFLLSPGYATDTAETVLKWRNETVTNLARHGRALIEWEVDSTRWLGVGDSAQLEIRHTAGAVTTTETRWVVLPNDQRPILQFTGMPLEALGSQFGSSFGPGLSVAGAELETGVGAVPYFSMGAARSSGLVYSTRTSYPRALVGVDLELPWPSGSPDQLKVMLLDTLGVKLDSVVSTSFPTSTCYNTTGPKRCRVVLQADYAGVALSPAIQRRRFIVEATVTLGGTVKAGSDTVETVLVDRRATAYGSGWWPSGLSQLVGAGQDRILVGPTGTATIYRGNGDSVYLPPPGSFTALVKTAGGWELRPRGSTARVVFDASGYLLKTVDANGNRDSVSYDGQARVATLYDPIGQQINFVYDGNGKVSKIRTLNGGAARELLLAVNGTTNQLTKDTVAGTTYVTVYTYNAVNATYKTTLLTRRIGVLLDSTVVAYHDSSSRPVQVTLPRVLDENGTSVTPVVTYTAYEQQGYHAFRQLDSVYVEVKDPRNNWTRSLLNRWGQARRTWDALGLLSRADYDPDGFVRWTEGKVADSSRVYTVYDQYRRVVTTYILGALTASDRLRGDSLVYDSNHRVIKRVDNRGKVDSMAYDANGNLIYAKDPSGNVARWAYLSDGRLDSLVAPGNSAGQRMVYETTWKHLRAVRDENGDTVQVISYDEFGRDTTSSQKIRVQVTADSTMWQWRRVRTYYSSTNAVDSTVLLRSNNCSASCGNPQWPPYVNGRYSDTTRVEYTRFHRDKAGRDTLRIDDRGIKTRYRYDLLGRLLVRWPWTDSAGVRDSMAYDVAGNLRKSFTRRGHTFEIRYDSRNRDTATVIPTVGRIRKQYSGPFDQLTRIWCDSGCVDSVGVVDTIAYGFDIRGRLKADTGYTGPVRRVTTFTYDSLERPITMADPVGTWVTRYETNRGMADTLITPMGDTIVYTFDAQNRPMGPTIYSGQKRFEVTPDWTQAGRLNGLTQAVTVGTSYTPLDFQLSALDTADLGPPLAPFWTERQGAGAGLDSLRDSVVYDGWERVTRWVGMKRASGGGWTVVAADSFSFDRTGNVRVPGTTVVFDSVTNRLLQRVVGADTFKYYYDRAGNLDSLLRKKTSVLERWHYGWNALNQLVSFRYNGTLVARYAYDVLGRRIVKRVYDGATGGTPGYTRFFYRGDHVAFETDTLGSTIGAKYTWGLGTDDLIAVRTGSDVSTHYYAVQDKLGSVRALVKRDGTWQASWRYGPYGAVVASAGTGIGLRYQWTGREYDIELGWYFHRARYYSPTDRRFVQEDPIGFAGGGNLYAYVGGAVLEARDPSGLIPSEDGQWIRNDKYWPHVRPPAPWCFGEMACYGVGAGDGRDDRPFSDANNDGIDDLNALVGWLWREQRLGLRARGVSQCNSVCDRTGQPVRHVEKGEQYYVADLVVVAERSTDIYSVTNASGEAVLAFASAQFRVLGWDLIIIAGAFEQRAPHSFELYGYFDAGLFTVLERLFAPVHVSGRNGVVERVCMNVACPCLGSACAEPYRRRG